MPKGPGDCLQTLRRVARTEKETRYATGLIPWDDSLTCTRLKSKLKRNGVTVRNSGGVAILENANNARSSSNNS